MDLNCNETKAPEHQVTAVLAPDNLIHYSLQNEENEVSDSDWDTISDSDSIDSETGKKLEEKWSPQAVVPTQPKVPVQTPPALSVFQ